MQLPPFFENSVEGSMVQPPPPPFPITAEEGEVHTMCMDFCVINIHHIDHIEPRIHFLRMVYFRVSTKPWKPGMYREFKHVLENLDKGFLVKLFYFLIELQNDVIYFSGLKFKSWFFMPTYSELSLFQIVSFQIN